MSDIGAPRSNTVGIFDDVPLSQWEQLVGLFDVRACGARAARRGRAAGAAGATAFSEFAILAFVTQSTRAIARVPAG